jgi:hypothetical protein
MPWSAVCITNASESEFSAETSGTKLSYQTCAHSQKAIHSMCYFGGQEPVSDRRESPHSYIDRVIWVALVIAIMGIGWLVVSNL